MPQHKMLDHIGLPRDLKQLTYKELEGLCAELREELIGTVSSNGGHLASNLGVVELTVALHRVFESPRDQIVWDVGHQCYTHKLLTGRLGQFHTLRKEGGLSGFCRPGESVHDSFISGHSSTSISAAFGLAKAKSIRGDGGYTIAVIGDGALTGGLAYEGLNNAGRSNDRLIVILNDNKMSISQNVGSIARHLALMRAKPAYLKFKGNIERSLRKIPRVGARLERALVKFKSGLKNLMYNNTIFENMGFEYLGPVDGHDLRVLCNVLTSCQNLRRPVLLHVSTVKGKGYPYAEENPKAFHGISKFDIETGDSDNTADCFSNVMGNALCALAAKDDRICAVTAAMTLGTGLSRFKSEFRDRFFDVGIAEEHAVTFSAGLAQNGMVPVLAVYSSFLQRGYDQLIHDVAIQRAKVVFAVDRAGIVGEDGETHQGVFDVSFLHTIPHLTILAPATYFELQTMLSAAVYDYPGPVAVRYPRGGEPSLPEAVQPKGEAFFLYGNREASCLMITFGRLFAEAAAAAQTLSELGIGVCVLKLGCVKPIGDAVYETAERFGTILCFEEGMKAGGIMESFACELFARGYKGNLGIHALDDVFVPQSTMAQGLRRHGLDRIGMVDAVQRLYAVRRVRDV